MIVHERIWVFVDFCPNPDCGRPFDLVPEDGQQKSATCAHCGESRFKVDRAKALLDREPRRNPDPLCLLQHGTSTPRARTAYLRPDALASFIIQDDELYSGLMTAHAMEPKPWMSGLATRSLLQVAPP
jgi:hypothetical protein